MEMTTSSNPNVLKLILTEIASPNRKLPPRPEMCGLIDETFILDTPEGERVLLIEVIQNPDPANKIYTATIAYDHTGQKVYEFLDFQSAWNVIHEFLNSARGLPTTGYVYSIPPLIAEAATSYVEMRWKHLIGANEEPVMRITAWVSEARRHTGKNDQDIHPSGSGIQARPMQPKGFTIPAYPFPRPRPQLSSNQARKRKRYWWQGQGWRIVGAAALVMALAGTIILRRLSAFVVNSSSKVKQS
jgi:hypothetical protein